MLLIKMYEWPPCMPCDFNSSGNAERWAPSTLDLQYRHGSARFFPLLVIAAKQETIARTLQRFLVFTQRLSLISKMALPVGGPEVFLAEE